ncbi:MAG: hypothetical protein HY291_22215 [Planctomycetes bacterium]|nr:hypothetical protein [Planctomycetota bacterium]
MNQEYIESLQRLIKERTKCESQHLRSEKAEVRDRQDGTLAWRGIVEVFNIFHHPTAFKCFAWDHSKGEREPIYDEILRMPPDKPYLAMALAIEDFNDPSKAVEYFIAYEARGGARYWE